MLRIGYVRSDVSGDSLADLTSLGCQVVRTEQTGAATRGASPALDAILDFIGEGDQLVVRRLDQLAASGRGMLHALERLEARGASLYIAEMDLCSLGPGGHTLRTVLASVAALEPPPAEPGRRPAATPEIRALRQAGLGPVEIARRLGVSRMAVWRRLKAAGA